LAIDQQASSCKKVEKNEVLVEDVAREEWKTSKHRWKNYNATIQTCTYMWE